MKFKRNPLTIPVILIILLLVASAVALNLNATRHYNDPIDTVRQIADDLQGWLDADGLEENKDNLSIAALNLGDSGNALVLAPDGTIRYAANDRFLDGRNRVLMMISPYDSWHTEWQYSDRMGSISEVYTGMALALMVDEQGAILNRFGALDNGEPFGTQLPRYQEYFPTLNPGAIEDARTFDEREDDIESLSPTAKQYVEWEDLQFRAVGQKRLLLRSLVNGDNLLLLFQSDNKLHEAEIQARAREYHISYFYMVFYLLLALSIVLLACWVFVDAKRREFKPALWGVLTLIGNIVTWIVYMMVRPEARQARACPGCGITLKQAYAFCPGCGHALMPKCAQCGRALDAAFRFCPDCGKPTPASEPGAPEALEAPAE